MINNSSSSHIMVILLLKTFATLVHSSAGCRDFMPDKQLAAGKRASVPGGEYPAADEASFQIDQTYKVAAQIIDFHDSESSDDYATQL